MDEPRVHVGVSRRQRHSDGSTTDYTVNLSGIPSTASPDLLAAMMGLANTGLGMIAAELDDRIGASFGPRITPRIDASVFTGPIPEAPSSADLDAAVANAVSVQIDAETGEVTTQVYAPAYDPTAEINRVAEALLDKQEPPSDRGEALD